MNWVTLAVLLLSPWLLASLLLALRWINQRAVRERQRTRRYVYGGPVAPVVALNYSHTVRQLADATGRYLIEPGPECSHWPRTPVMLADGTKVASLCHKCDATVYHPPYVNAEDVTR